jgi:hypothetical protein
MGPLESASLHDFRVSREPPERGSLHRADLVEDEFVVRRKGPRERHATFSGLCPGLPGRSKRPNGEISICHVPSSVAMVKGHRSAAFQRPMMLPSGSAKCAKVSVSGMTVTRAIVLPPARSMRSRYVVIVDLDVWGLARECLQLPAEEVGVKVAGRPNCGR